MNINYYEAPSVRLFKVIPIGIVLTSAKNVETMNTVQGSWDEE